MTEPSRGGQILTDVSPAGIDIIDDGNSDLNSARTSLYRSWVRSSVLLRQPLLEVNEEVSDFLKESEFSLDATRLLDIGRIGLERLIQSRVRRAFVSINDFIEREIKRTIEIAQRIQEAYLISLGFPRLSLVAKKDIRNRVFELLGFEFPLGSGRSYRTRLLNLETNHILQLMNFTRRNYLRGDAKRRMSRDIESGLIHDGPGRTPVVGGSAYRQSRRLMVAEEARLSNEVELGTIRSVGGSYAYWRLSAAHKWYGGREICEHYASRIMGDVKSELESMGIRVSFSMLKGLHKVDDWPQFPHPFCKCYPEPWLI